MSQQTVPPAQGAGNRGSELLEDLMAGVEQLAGNTMVNEPGDGERGDSQSPAPSPSGQETGPDQPHSNEPDTDPNEYNEHAPDPF